MVVDILSGGFRREHHDIDGFTLNLSTVQDRMDAALAQRGYTVSYVEEIGALRVETGGIHATINELEIDGENAMWHHAGRQGTVHFPVAWLDSTARKFLGARVYTCGVLFEYAIKTNPRLLNPQWQPRDKDHDAVAFLEQQLATSSMRDRGLLSEIWSYSPYWVERGYPEYAKPVGVPREVRGQCNTDR
jgi:hypothetical protein